MTRFGLDQAIAEKVRNEVSSTLYAVCRNINVGEDVDDQRDWAFERIMALIEEYVEVLKKYPPNTSETK